LLCFYCTIDWLAKRPEWLLSLELAALPRPAAAASKDLFSLALRLRAEKEAVDSTRTAKN